ncbi:hypothetical protein ElyMa_002366700 [Elysia marginata]|uniref:Uncharacterized protein n=1 Tax=Elysia marginata TaxID=1093978 RepID=A0AAV4GAY1_9GAST|nr:hypothetical protein ElyMa_002366700 [Elysia marginata]
MHTLRANYQALIWKQADKIQPKISNPEFHCWKINDDGVLSIEWCKDLVPQQLADILSGTEDNKEQESNDEDLIPSDSENISDESREKYEEQDGE